MEHIVEIGVGLVVAALSLYLKHRYNLNVLARAQEILETAADLGIGAAEEEGHRQAKKKANGISGEQKEAIAVEVAKREALALAEKAGKGVVKKVAGVLADRGEDAVKGIIKSRLGLSRLGRLF